MSITSYEVRNATFTKVRLRESYRAEEVDAFLKRVVFELDASRGTLTAADVRSAKFTPTRLRAGYDMYEVDEFLDRVDAELRRREVERRGHA